MNRTRAVLYLLGAALLWSTGGLLIKSVPWSPISIAGSRSLIAALVLWPFCNGFRFTRSPILWGGALAYAATVILFVMANKLTTAANAILLQYTAPVYVALLSRWFLGEKTYRLDSAMILMALLGMVLFFFDELSLSNVWGNGLAIASGISFAWLTLLLRKQKDGSPLESVLLGNILAAGIALLISPPPLQTQGWVIIAGMGVFQLALPYLLYSKAIREVRAVDAMLIMFIEPIFNPLWVLLFQGEKPGPMAMVGGTIILIAVLGRNLAPLFLR